MRDVIATKEGPQAIGPYSQAIRANGFVFVSGQVAIDPANQQVISGDVAAQTDRVHQEPFGDSDRGRERPEKSRAHDRLPQKHGRLHRDE